MATHENHFRSVAATQPGQSFGEFEARQFGHAEVRYNHPRPAPVGQQLEGLPAIPGRKAGQTGLGEKFDELLDGIGIIVHNQDVEGSILGNGAV